MNPPEINIAVHRKGTGIMISQLDKIMYSNKEYLDMLDRLKIERNEIVKKIESGKRELIAGDEQLKKLNRYQNEAEKVILSGMNNILEKIKSTGAYLKHENKKAYLFSQKELMEYAPEYILRREIFNKKD